MQIYGNDIICGDVGIITEYLNSVGQDSIIVEKMTRDIGGPMWCKNTAEFVGEGDCGVMCIEYEPR